MKRRAGGLPSPTGIEHMGVSLWEGTDWGNSGGGPSCTRTQEDERGGLPHRYHNWCKLTGDSRVLDQNWGIRRVWLYTNSGRRARARSEIGVEARAWRNTWRKITSGRTDGGVGVTPGYME